MPPRHAGRRRRPRSPERPANDDIDRILEEERVAAARGERVTKKTKITAVVVGALGVIGAAVLALSTVLPRANEPDAFPNPAQPAYSLVESQVEFYVIEGGKRVYYGGRKEATCPVTNSDWDAPKNIQRDKNIVKHYKQHTADVVQKAKNRIYKMTFKTSVKTSSRFSLWSTPNTRPPPPR